MHEQARMFTLWVKTICNPFFEHCRVLDVGSGDINGNNEHLFDSCVYDGNDVIAAKNVTVVSPTHLLSFPPCTFDTIISTECFEHDPEYVASWKKIYELLKPGGLFVFTCASTGRPEHGTRRTTPHDSWGTIGDVVSMRDYYKNLTVADLSAVFDLNTMFSVWDAYFNASSHDLYFVGIKVAAGASFIQPLITYTAPHVVCTSGNVSAKHVT